VVECEREMLVCLNWDLMMPLPCHFLKAFLANGVIFENEELGLEKVARVQIKSQELLEQALKQPETLRK